MKTKFKYYLVMIYIVVLALIIMPQVHLKIADTEISYPDITLEKILGIESTWFKPKQSSKLFASNEVIVSINSDENSQKILEVIAKRLELAGLYDVEVELRTSDNTSKSLVFEYPSHYENYIYLTELISKKGNISFGTYSLGASISSDEIDNIKARDISTNFNRKFTRLFTPAGNYYLTTKVNPDKQLQLDQAFVMSGGQFEILIDGVPRYIVAQSEKAQLLEPGQTTNEIRIFSSDLIASAQKQLAELEIFKTYFASEPLQIEVIETLVRSNSPVYVPSGASTLGIAFIISTLAIGLYFGNKNSATFGLRYFMLLSSVGVTMLFILKLVSANISIGTLLGFLVTFLITNVLAYIILTTDSKSELALQLKNIRKFSLLNIFGLFIIANYSPMIGVLTDAVGVLIVMNLVILLNSSFVFKYLVSYD